MEILQIVEPFDRTATTPVLTLFPNGNIIALSQQQLQRNYDSFVPGRRRENCHQKQPSTIDNSADGDRCQTLTDNYRSM